MTGVAGGTVGATVNKEKGEVQVGFGSETTPVSLSGLAEVGQTFEVPDRSIPGRPFPPDQVVTATLFVEWRYNVDLAAGSRAKVDIEIFVSSTGSRTITRALLSPSIAATGPTSLADESRNPSPPPPPAPGTSPDSPLDARTLGYDITFTKRRGTRYTVGLSVNAGLDGTGRVQVTGILKEIRLRRAV